MKPVAVAGDVFAGLFSAGVRDAGYEVSDHFENSDYGHGTAELNFPQTRFHVDASTWREGVAEIRKPVHLFFCNPPCAIWSNARPNTGASHGSAWSAGASAWQEDPRVQWHENLVRVGLDIKPKVFVLESILPAWRRGRDHFMKLRDIWMKADYDVTLLLQNNMYIGGTQNRKRLFFIAHQHPLVWPAFTAPKTVGELLKPLGRQTGRPLRENLAWCYARSKPGDKLRKLTKTGEYHGPGISFLFTRLDPDAPPPVMISHESMIHPKEPRWLNLDEMRALNGVPPWFKTREMGLGAIGAEFARAVHAGPGKWIAIAALGGAGRKRGPIRTAVVVDMLDPKRVVDYGMGEEARRMDREEAEEAPRRAPKPHAKREEVSSVDPARYPLMEEDNGRVGRYTRRLLLDGLGDQAVLDCIHAHFQGSKATKADVAYHKYHLRKEGLRA